MWSPVTCKPSIYCSNGGGYRLCQDRSSAVARTVVAAEAGYNNLKQELVQAVVEFFRWRDVFVSLLATASLSSMGFCLGHSASTGTAAKDVKCFGY